MSVSSREINNREIRVDRFDMEENGNSFQSPLAKERVCAFITREQTRGYAAKDRNMKAPSIDNSVYVAPTRDQRTRCEVDQLKVRFNKRLPNGEQKKARWERWSAAEKIALFEAWNKGLRGQKLADAVNVIEGNDRSPNGVRHMACCEMNTQMRRGWNAPIKMGGKTFDDEFIDLFRK